jgi:hypothetical protein
VHLRGLPELNYLDLDGTRVTDAGLAHLVGLSNVSNLRRHGTKVTDVGVKALNQALPALTIVR